MNVVSARNTGELLLSNLCQLLMGKDEEQENS